jgi:hypothetical protein
VATILKSRSRVADPYSAQLPDSDNPQTRFDVRIIVVSHAQLLIQTLEQMNDCRRLHLQKSFGERLLAETILDAVVRRPHRYKRIIAPALNTVVGGPSNWQQSARRLVDILIAGSRPVK